MANQVIDSHVHCRDEEQSGKATIAEVLGLAREQGVDMIFDMPNTARPVVNRERVKERLALVPKGSEACYRLYVGLTADPAQIEKAVWCFNDFKEVIGLKLYAGPSTGDLAVLKASEQFLIYKTLSQFGYIGVLAVHCEKATHFLLDSFHSFRPITYCDVRPKIAEIESVGDQICFAEEAHFLGILHICHVSCKETVDLVEAARKRGLIRITCGVTPHHIMYDNTAMLGSDGYRHICNPPLREYGDVFALRCCVV